MFSRLLFVQANTALKQKMAKESIKATMEDLPNEVIEKCIMACLDFNDLHSFGSIGIGEFKEMAENVIKKRGA